jgi:hypothetical protein
MSDSFTLPAEEALRYEPARPAFGVRSLETLPVTFSRVGP